MIKPNPGESTATTAGSFGPTLFALTAPTTLTLSFDYKLVTSGSSPKEAQLSFDLSDGTSTYSVTPAPFESGHSGNYVTGNVTIAIGGTGPATITGFGFLPCLPRPASPSRSGWTTSTCAAMAAWRCASGVK